MISIAVKEGWAGGPWHSKQFRQALKSAGFNVTDPLHADVLFAHSTACYDLPLKSPINFYFLIDPPYWPGKPLWARVIAKKRHDNATLKQAMGRSFVLKKTLWEGIYVFEKPKYSLLALKQHGKLDFLSALKGKQIVVIRNEQDPFCSPDIQVALSS